jgi:hypothetical protein
MRRTGRSPPRGKRGEGGEKMERVAVVVFDEGVAFVMTGTLGADIRVSFKGV